MTFISSRGYAFTERAGAITVDGPGQGRLIADGRIGSALAEFVEYKRGEFRAEEDARLGRWRFPLDPDYVVYPIPDRIGVMVLRESTGMRGFYYPGESGKNTTEDMGVAAVAYFAAHPEPKPWHDAKPGELWVIRLGEEDEIGVSVEGFEAGADVFQVPGGESISITRPSITAGRRIWPEPTV